MPSLVQVKAGATQSPPLTITLDSATTGGNCLVALIGDVAVDNNGVPSGITLGGAADHWAQAAIQGSGTDHGVAAGWADPNCAGGQSAVVITTTGGAGTENVFAWVFEFSGLGGTLDQSSGGANSFAATWDSGATPVTSQASEVWFGIMCGTSSGTPSLAGPASPWVNEAQQSSGQWAAICGYQVTSSAGSADYAGTASPDGTADVLVFTLPGSGSPPPPGPAAAPVPSAGAVSGWILLPAQGRVGSAG